jgi:hypothetical protein
MDGFPALGTAPGVSRVLYPMRLLQSGHAIVACLLAGLLGGAPALTAAAVRVRPR